MADWFRTGELDDIIKRGRQIQNENREPDQRPQQPGGGGWFGLPDLGITEWVGKNLGIGPDAAPSHEGARDYSGWQDKPQWVMEDAYREKAQAAPPQAPPPAPEPQPNPAYDWLNTAAGNVYDWLNWETRDMGPGQAALRGLEIPAETAERAMGATEAGLQAGIFNPENREAMRAGWQAGPRYFSEMIGPAGGEAAGLLTGAPQTIIGSLQSNIGALTGNEEWQQQGREKMIAGAGTRAEKVAAGQEIAKAQPFTTATERIKAGEDPEAVLASIPEDPTSEFIGRSVFDPLNLLDAPLGAAFKGVRGAKAAKEALPLVTNPALVDDVVRQVGEKMIKQGSRASWLDPINPLRMFEPINASRQKALVDDAGDVLGGVTAHVREQLAEAVTNPALASEDVFDSALMSRVRQDMAMGRTPQEIERALIPEIINEFVLNPVEAVKRYNLGEGTLNERGIRSIALVRSMLTDPQTKRVDPLRLVKMLSDSKNVDEQVQMLAEAVHGAAKTFYPDTKSPGVVGKAGDIRDGINRAFSAMYLGVSPAYAWRNIGSNVVHGTVDEGVSAMLDVGSVDSTMRRLSPTGQMSSGAERSLRIQDVAGGAREAKIERLTEAREALKSAQAAGDARNIAKQQKNIAKLERQVKGDTGLPFMKVSNWGEKQAGRAIFATNIKRNLPRMLERITPPPDVLQHLSPSDQRYLSGAMGGTWNAQDAWRVYARLTGGAAPVAPDPQMVSRLRMLDPDAAEMALHGQYDQAIAHLDGKERGAQKAARNVQAPMANHNADIAEITDGAPKKFKDQVEARDRDIQAKIAANRAAEDAREEELWGIATQQAGPEATTIMRDTRNRIRDLDLTARNAVDEKRAPILELKKRAVNREASWNDVSRMWEEYFPFADETWTTRHDQVMTVFDDAERRFGGASPDVPPTSPVAPVSPIEPTSPAAPATQAPIPEPSPLAGLGEKYRPANLNGYLAKKNAWATRVGGTFPVKEADWRAVEPEKIQYWSEYLDARATNGGKTPKDYPKYAEWQAQGKLGETPAVEAMPVAPVEQAAPPVSAVAEEDDMLTAALAKPAEQRSRMEQRLVEASQRNAPDLAGEQAAAEAGTVTPEQRAWLDDLRAQVESKEQLAQDVAQRGSATVKVADINVDPDRFQYKLGTGPEGTTTALSKVEKWNPDLGAGVALWLDPADGKTYVVNGHHRVALAKKLKADEIAAPYYIEANTAEEARAIGALQNIAGGRGSELDAAKFFRDTKMTADELAAQGISLSEAKARDGLALSKLHLSLFNATVRGEIPLKRAIIIGQKIDDPNLQMQLVKQINGFIEKGRKVNDDVVSELADAMVSGPKETVSQMDMFGAMQVEKSYVLEKAHLQAYIKGRLAQEKRLFGVAARNADQLGRVGSIDRTASQDISTEAGQLLELFDRVKNQRGAIGDALNDAASRIGKGGDTGKIEAEAYERIVKDLPGVIEGQQANRVAGVSPGQLVGEPVEGEAPVRAAEGQASLFGEPQAGEVAAEVAPAVPAPNWGELVSGVEGVPDGMAVARHTKYENARGKYALIDAQGKMNSNYVDTPEQAITEYHATQRNIAARATEKQARDSVLVRFRAGEDLSDADKSIIGGGKTLMKSDAVSLFRELTGSTVKEARNNIEGASWLRETRGGGIVYSSNVVVDRAQYAVKKQGKVAPLSPAVPSQAADVAARPATEPRMTPWQVERPKLPEYEPGQVGQEVASGTVLAPNRKLGMQYAAWGDDDAATSPLIALSNLQKGESFTIHNTKYTVANITDKSIVFTTDGGKRLSYTLNQLMTGRGQQFLRDIEDLLVSSYHGVDAGDLPAALRRDPAFYQPSPRIARKGSPPPAPAPLSPAVPSQAADVAAKEPWQMTRGEYDRVEVQRLMAGRSPSDPEYEWRRRVSQDNVLQYHKAEVSRAIREGRPVPPEVLADYPDLAAKAAPPASSAEKPLWTKTPSTYLREKNIYEPWMGEISETQMARMSKRQRKSYLAKRGGEWDAAKQGKNEWGDQVYEAYKRGEFDLDNPESSFEARDVVRKRIKLDQESAVSDAWTGSNNIQSVEELNVGDRVFDVMRRDYATVTKKYKNSVRVKFDDLPTESTVNVRQLKRQSFDDLKASISTTPAAPSAPPTGSPRQTDIFGNSSLRRQHHMERGQRNFEPGILPGERRQVRRYTPAEPTIMDDLAQAQVDANSTARDLVQQMRQTIAEAPTASGLSAQGKTALRGWVRNTWIPNINNSRREAEHVATMARDFTLHNYGNRRNIDVLLYQFFPYSFWWTHTAPKWLERMAQHPGMIASYLRSRNLREKLNKDRPEFYRQNVDVGPLFGVDDPLYVNIEQTLNPMYAMMNDFNDRDKSDPLSKAVQWVGNQGLSLWTPAIWALAFGLNATGHQDAAKSWAGYTSQATKAFKSGTALLGANKGRGITLDPQLWPSLAEPGQGMDKWDQNRMGAVLTAMKDRGAITQAEFEDAAYKRSGPIWERAEAELMQGPEGKPWQGRAMANMAAYGLGAGFKPRSETDEMLYKAQGEWYDLMGQRESMTPDQWSGAIDAFKQQYPFWDAYKMSSKTDQAGADTARAWLILNRLPPGKQRTEMLRGAGITEELSDRFYDDNGDMSAWSEPDRMRMQAGIETLAMSVQPPSPQQQAEYQRVKDANAQMKQIAAQQFGADIEALEDKYMSMTTEQRKAWREANPADYARFSGYQEMKKQYRAQTGLDKYYGSTGTQAQPTTFKGQAYNQAKERFGEDIWDINDGYFAAGEKGSLERKVYLAQNPILKDLWSFWDVVEGKAPTTQAFFSGGPAPRTQYASSSKAGGPAGGTLGGRKKYSRTPGSSYVPWWLRQTDRSWGGARWNFGNASKRG